VQAVSIETIVCTVERLHVMGVEGNDGLVEGVKVWVTGRQTDSSTTGFTHDMAIWVLFDRLHHRRGSGKVLKRAW